AGVVAATRTPAFIGERGPRWRNREPVWAWPRWSRWLDHPRRTRAPSGTTHRRAGSCGLAPHADAGGSKHAIHHGPSRLDLRDPLEVDRERRSLAQARDLRTRRCRPRMAR